MSIQHIHRLALTPGEPAGIGPDILLQLAQRGYPHELVVYADPALLEQRAAQLNLNIQLQEFAADKPAAPQQAGTLTIVPCSLRQTAQAAKLNPANAEYVLECLRRACHACVEGLCHALITGPVNKAVINQAGVPFSGHTEFLAAETHTAHVVMMLATPKLKVALATTHLPLSEVSRAITAPVLERTISILEADLRGRFDLPQPRITVCGLNPHAGEDGHLGHEEQEIIIPLLNLLRRQGFHLTGPLPADTAFTPEALQNADAVLAMYHDQGLPVLKSQGFGEAVNITLGLPIIRTSVDHGTALELAASGKARSDSLQAALAMACRLRSGFSAL